MEEDIEEEIRLIQGDCLNVMDKLISEDVKVDLILTDPPYGTTACKWDTVIPLDKMWIQLKRIIKDNGVIVLFGSEPFSSALRMSNIKNYKYDWIWDKKRPTGMALVKKQPMRQTENISIFYDSQCLYNRQFTEKNIKYQRPNKRKSIALKPYRKIETLNRLSPKFSDEWDDTKKNPITLLSFSNSNNNKQHPTQKPVALLEYLIKTYTIKNETILDNTMGSGSTGVACVNTKRNFIGIEKELNYFDIAKQRIEDAQAQGVLF